MLLSKVLSNKKGQSALELAYCFPILLIVIFSFFDFMKLYSGLLDASSISAVGARAIVTGTPAQAEKIAKDYSINVFSGQIEKIKCGYIGKKGPGELAYCNAKMNITVSYSPIFGNKSGTFIIPRMHYSLQEDTR